MLSSPVQGLFFFALIALLAQASLGSELGEINGIRYQDYKNFDKKWKIVTVRFRQDTEEMRFTYANPIAYKALLAGKTNYPDGAVFGKVGVRTGSDSLFESSKVPLGARRYQLMVRNQKKYKNQAGWGYALFDEKGFAFPEKHETQVVACAACHELAAERGYVFSQAVDVSLKQDNSSEDVSKKIVFQMLARKDLPENILSQIPEHFNFVRIMQSKMSENLFQGTLEEVRPILSKESFETRQPAILKSSDGLRFSLVYPENLGSFCSNHGRSGLFMRSLFTKLDDKKLIELSYCQTP